MRMFGLIGFPLSHSFSKKFFSDKFEKESLVDCRYENFPITSIQELPGLFKTHPFLEGINITIPYKEEVIPFLHTMNTVVDKIRACNCIKLVNGELHGYNTDVIGFEVSLEQNLQPTHNKALILGTGGAAKAVAYVLEKKGIEYIFVSRSSSDRKSRLGYEEVTDDIIRSHTLIVNTTPLGMYPHVKSFPPLNYDKIGPEHYLYDLTYNPEKTAFLKIGEEAGAAIKNGQDMLVIQAEESWRIWNES